LDNANAQTTAALLSSAGYDRFFTFARRMNIAAVFRGIDVEFAPIDPFAIDGSRMVLALKSKATRAHPPSTHCPPFAP
jgi:hypothetical protein